MLSVEVSPDLATGSAADVSSMRAAVLEAPQSWAARSVPRPEIRPGEVRVRLTHCGVCASNVPPWEGRPWFSYPMAPGALGHEACGLVDEVASDVIAWRVGDPVAVLSHHAFAEFDVAPADCLAALPPELADSGFPAEAVGCALNIFARAEIKSGQRVAIIGVGFLGALLVQLAVRSGAQVTAFARRPFARETAEKFGAETIDLVTHDRTAAVHAFQQRHGGSLADVVIEATGKPEPLNLAGELTRERGRLVIAGFHQDGARQIDLQLWNWRGLDVINAHERDPKIYLSGIRAGIEAVQSGNLDLRPLLTHHFPLEDLSQALALTRDRPDGFMKAIIDL